MNATDFFHGVQAVCAVVILCCAGLGVYVRLSGKAQAADLLKDIESRLEKFYVRKDVHQATQGEVNRRLAALESGRG